MAFRKSSKKWWPGKRTKIPAARIPRSIARVRKQRTVLFNTMQQCEFTCVEIAGESCVTNESIILIRNSQLQQDFGDNVKVVSLRGSVLFRPLPKVPFEADAADCDAAAIPGVYGDYSAWVGFFNRMRNTVLQMRCGLTKTLTTSGTPLGFEVPEYFLDESFDWSEGNFLRKWEHFWITTERYSIDHLQQAAQLGNGSTASSENGQIQHGFRHIDGWRPWRIPLNIRRTISLKENENLEMPFALAHLSAGADCNPLGPTEDPCQQGCQFSACMLQVFPNIVATIQYG